MQKELMKTAIESAKLGGKIISDGFYMIKQIELKGFADPVTQFDKASEKAIVEYILSKYPDHSILTEEALSSEGDGNVRWIIDPLDGTVNFTHKSPYVAVSIGIEIEKKIVAGVIFNPILDELYTASIGEGAFLNGEKINVSKISDPGKSMIVTGFPYERDGRMKEMIRPLQKIIKDYESFRRLGSAAMDLAYVARGICDAFYEENLKPWDTAAGDIIVREAGGKVSDYYGKDYSVYNKTILASNGCIHNNMIDVLKDVKSP